MTRYAVIAGLSACMTYPAGSLRNAEEQERARHPDLVSLKLELQRAEALGALRDHHARELLGEDYAASPAQTLGRLNEIEGLLFAAVKRHLPRDLREQARSVTDTLISEGYRRGFDPVFLAAVAMTESSFNPRARGMAGEVGLLQLMPGTARWIAEKEGLPLGDDLEASLEDPVLNLKLGAAYFEGLRKDFESRSNRYVAAYNMGGANVRAALAREVEPREYFERVVGRYHELYRSLSDQLKPRYAFAERFSEPTVRADASASQVNSAKLITTASARSK